MAPVDLRIRLKDPWLAGFLAFLLPGLGHLYQGRTFKAAIYAVCILGLFFSGMALAGWRAVQAPPFTHRDIPSSRIDTLKFLAQAPVGLPVLYSVVQSHRYYDKGNQAVSELSTPIDSAFEGRIQMDGEMGLGQESQVIEGQLRLMPAQQQLGSPMIAGELAGIVNGTSSTYQLRQVRLEKPVRADRWRELHAQIIQQEGDRERMIGLIDGKIRRPFKDWFEVPLDENQQQELHRELGKFHELAMVLTWVAGLLNILAIWDTVEGPAYGYGDEEPAASPS